MAGFCPCSFGNSLSSALSNLKNAKRLNPDRPKESAPATVLARRVVRRNEMFENDPWAYLVTFQLENGEKKELKVSQESYQQLPEGTAGTLVWQEDALVCFP